MITEYVKTLTLSATGALDTTVGHKINGVVRAIKYTIGTLGAGTGLTITGETTAVPILVDASAAASEWYYPLADRNKNTDGTALTDFTELIRVSHERIRIVIAGGDNAGAGRISFCA